MSNVEEKDPQVAAAPAAKAEPAEKPEGGFEFDEKFQRKIAALAVRDTVFVQRTEGLVLPEYFEHAADRAMIAVVQDFYKKYKKAPDPSSLAQALKLARDDKKIRPELWPDIRDRLGKLLSVSLADRDFVIDQVAAFARNTAMQNAIMASIPLIDKGDYAKIEQLIKAAVMVGAADDDNEYDYAAEIANRTDHRVALLTGTIKPDGISTGFADMDKHMYHGGWGRKELSAIMGRAKFGKSMALGDFGKNAYMLGYKVLIVSLEVSERIYADRIDANIAETAMQVLKQNAFAIKAKIEAAEQKANGVGGVLKLHAFASGTYKPSQLRRLIERYRTRGIIFDLLVVDYADIMCPERVTDSVTENSKSVWLDLRAIAFEQNAAVLTATQTNRDGAKAATAKATDVAEDYNKVRIADLLLSGNATEAEISAGEARLHFAASRNQAEVTLRIAQKRDQMKFFTKVLGVS